MTNGDDYAGTPDTSSNATDTAEQPAEATSADYTAEEPAQTTSADYQQTAYKPQQTDTTSDGDQTVEALTKAYNDDRERWAKSQAYYKNLDNQVADINQRLQAVPMPAVPQHIPIPSMPDQQALQRQQNGSIGTMIAHGIMIAGLASVVFGRHHNTWGAASMMAGLGSFINGFTKAQKETATDQLQNWNKSVEYAVKQNQEADRTYNEILANKNLDMRQQSELIKQIAAQRHDIEMYKAATTGDLNKIIEKIEMHEKANEAMSRAQIDVNSRAANLWLKGDVGQSWSDYVRTQSQKDGDPINPNANDGGASFRKARDKYSPTQWIESQRKGAKAAKEEKPVTYESYEKEVKAALGKDSAGNYKADTWKDVLEGRGAQPIRGDFDKDGNWHNDPKGSLYATPDSGAGQKHEGGFLGWGATSGNPSKDQTADAKAIDDLRKLRARVGGGGGQGQAKKDYPQVNNQAEASKLAVGTIFKDPQGNIRKILSQNPFQVSGPLDQSQTQ